MHRRQIDISDQLKSSVIEQLKKKHIVFSLAGDENDITDAAQLLIFVPGLHGACGIAYRRNIGKQKTRRRPIFYYVQGVSRRIS